MQKRNPQTEQRNNSAIAGAATGTILGLLAFTLVIVYVNDSSPVLYFVGIGSSVMALISVWYVKRTLGRKP